MFENKPIMGWTSQYLFGDTATEQNILEIANAMVATGLSEAGYQTIILADGWAAASRNGNGELTADPNKFPHGLLYLSNELHAKGLKLGICTGIGFETAAGCPGILDHEYQDAMFFAANGVDLVKLDGCTASDSTDSWTMYHRIRMALNATGREILMSVSCSNSESVAQWAHKAGCDLYGSPDIHPDSDFLTVMKYFHAHKNLFNLSLPGCYHDLGVLPIEAVPKNPTEADTCFKVWCMLSTPLILGCDIQKMDADTIRMITNPELLAIHQDPECRPPIHMTSLRHDDIPCMFRHLHNGEYALSITSVREELNIYVYVLLPDMGFPADGHYGIRLWDTDSGQEVGTFTDAVTIPTLEPHRTRVFRGKVVKLR